jgi:hypothetical protein
MATAFKNARLLVTTAYSTAYICPAATTAIILSINAATVAASSGTTLSAQWLDSSNTNAVTRFILNAPMYVGVAEELIVNKLVLEAGDALQFVASAVSSSEVTISIMELS